MYNKDIRRMLQTGKHPGLLLDIYQDPEHPQLKITVYRDNIESFSESVRTGMILWLHEKMSEVNEVTPAYLSIEDFVPPDVKPVMRTRN